MIDEIQSKIREIWDDRDRAVEELYKDMLKTMNPPLSDNPTAREIQTRGLKIVNQVDNTALDPVDTIWFESHGCRCSKKLDVRKYQVKISECE